MEKMDDLIKRIIEAKRKYKEETGKDFVLDEEVPNYKELLWKKKQV